MPHSEDLLAYLLDLWYVTETHMPTVSQLTYLLYLIEDRKGVDPSFWQRDVLTRRDVGAIINALTRLPKKKVRDSSALPTKD